MGQVFSGKKGLIWGSVLIIVYSRNALRVASILSLYNVDDYTPGPFSDEPQFCHWITGVSINSIIVFFTV